MGSSTKVGSVGGMDNYTLKVLNTIRKLDADTAEPHPTLSHEQVAEAMDPPETDDERLDHAIAELTEGGSLEPVIPAIQQTEGPVSFRLTY